MKVEIRDYGQRCQFPTITAALNELQTEFRDKHVTLVFSIQNRADRVIYVSVDSHGNVCESYGQQRDVTADLVRELTN